jgi:ABC-type antimicrobial peptide transport system permease subunit
VIRTRFRKVIRDLMARKGRTALVSTAIFIGVAGVIALFSMSDILIGQLREDIQEEELAMIEINVGPDTEGIEPNNQLYLDQVRNVATVTEVQASALEGVYFSTDPDEISFGDLEEAVMQGYLTPLDEVQIEPFRLIEGEWALQGDAEVMVETRTAEEYGLSVGDEVYFRVLSVSEGETARTEARTISGIVFHPYAFAPTETFYSFAEEVNYFAGTIGISTFDIRLESYPDPQDEDAFDAFDATVDELETVLEASPYTVTFTSTEDPENNQLITGAQTFASLFQTLAIISLIVSGFLVVNVITAIVTEQRNQIGVMKALGATRQDNFFIYTGIAFMYGVLGVIPGVIVGIPAGYWAAEQLAPELNTLLDGFDVSPSGVFIGVLVGMAVPIVFALMPVFNATRVSILEAMTDIGISTSYGTGPLARLLKWLPIPITVRQGFANIIVKKFRSLFTVLTLTVAVGAFVGIYSVFDSIRDGIGQYLDSFNTEIGIAPTAAQDSEQFTALLRSNYGVDDAESGFIQTIEPGFFLQVDFLDDEGEKYEPSFGAGGPPAIFAYGIDVFSDQPAFTFTLDEGERWTDDNAETGIILTGALQRGLGVEIGEAVTLAVPGSQREFEVIGVSEFPIDQAYVNWEVLADMRGNRYVPPEDRVAGVTDNEYFTPVMIAGVEGALGGATPALGINTQFGEILDFTEGQLFQLEANEFIVSASLAEQTGLAVGDSVEVQSTQDAGTTETFTLAGIFEIPNAFTANLEAANIPPALSLFHIRDLASLNGIELPEGSLYPQIYFLLTNLDDPTASDIDDRLNMMQEDFLDNGISTFTLNFVEFQEQFTQGLLQIQLILSAVALLIAIVGALGLLTTLSMSVYERQKEIGVMRSIGARSSTIAFQFLTEGIVVGVLAWLIGLPLSVGIQALLFEITGFGDTFELSFPVQGALIALVGTLVITTIASIGPSLSAANRTVSDILRYQ